MIRLVTGLLRSDCMPSGPLKFRHESAQFRHESMFFARFVIPHGFHVCGGGYRNVAAKISQLFQSRSPSMIDPPPRRTAHRSLLGGFLRMHVTFSSHGYRHCTTMVIARRSMSLFLTAIGSPPLHAVTAEPDSLWRRPSFQFMATLDFR